MAWKKTNDTYYGEIASAIRAKNGTNNTYQPSQMAGAINALPTNLIQKTITQNGVYNASSDNADGYSTVTVSVPGLTIEEVLALTDGMEVKY